MKKVKIVSFFVLFFLIVHLLLPLGSTALTSNTNYYVIQISCNDFTVPVSGIVIDIYEEILDTSETNQKTRKYDDIFAFSKTTDANGETAFERPSDVFSFDVDLSSLPEGYGISEKSAFIQDDQNIFEIELSKIVSTVYDEDASEFLCYDINGKTLFSKDSQSASFCGNNNDKNQTEVSDYNDCNCLRYTSGGELLRTDPPISARTDHFLVKIDETGIPTSQYSTYISKAQYIANAFEAIDTLYCTNNGFTRPGSTQCTDVYYVQVVPSSAVDGNRAITQIAYNSTDSDIAINFNLLDYVDITTGTISNSWLGVFAHEYMHAIMYKYHIGTNVLDQLGKWMQESFAKACGFIYDSTYINYSSNGHYVNAEQIQVYINSSDDTLTDISNSNRKYGSSVFPLYIYENLGGYATIKDIYERCNVYNGQVFTPPTTAIKQAINNYISYDSTRFAREFAEFSTYLYNVLEYFDTIQNSNHSIVNTSILSAPGYPYTTPSSYQSINPLASRIFKYSNYTAPVNTHAQLVMKVTKTTTGDAALAFNTLQEDNSGTYTITSHSLSSNSHIIVDNFGTNDCTTVALVVANAGLYDSGTVSVYAKVSYAPATNMNYSIKNVGSGYFIGIYDTSPESNIYQYAQSYYGDQEFSLLGITGHTDGYCIRLKNLTSIYINVEESGGAAYNGANVLVGSSRPIVQQVWTFTFDDTSGYYKISPYEDSSLALTAYGDSIGSNGGTSPTSDGNIFVSTYTGSNHQLWELVPVSSS